MAPCIGVVSYFAMGISIATFGPLSYLGYNKFITPVYILFIVIFFGLSFIVGSRMRTPSKVLWRKDQNQPFLNILFRSSLIISILVMSYELIYMARATGLSLSVTNAASSYVEGYSNYTRNSGSYSARFLITSMCALPLFIAQVFGLYYFEILDKPTRLGIVYLFVVSIVVYTFGAGKQKQFGDIMIYMLSALIAKQAAAGRLRLTTWAKIGGVLFGGVFVLLVFLAARYQAIGIDLIELNANLHNLVEYREGYWLEKLLGEVFAFPLIIFSGYLGQGYFGLSLALEQPFTWTAFVGSSYSMSVILHQFFGVEFLVEKSYPYLVGDATGWGQTKWHTVFAWLASDLTFWGVPPFMGILGFIYGRVWREILIHKNPFALLVFALMNIGFVYAPANNQLMHSPGALSTTLGVFFLYVLFHKNFNAAPTGVRKLKFLVST